MGRPDQHRVANFFSNTLRFLNRGRGAIRRLGQIEVIHEFLEPFTILGQINGVRICPENGNTRGFQRPHQLERRLPAELDDPPLLPNPWPAHRVQAR